MRKLFVLTTVLIAVAGMALAWGGPAPRGEVNQTALVGEKHLIDNFESGNLSAKGWWTFDLDTARAVNNSDLTEGRHRVGDLGNYSLALEGRASNWYAGGVGLYIAKENQDLSKYNSIRMDVYGNGEGSGTLKIELYDDDNNNWQIEQDRTKNYAPIYDDKFAYELLVDWKGWKSVEILLADFVDENPGVGDDIYNPSQANGSGGLLQIQFVCLAATDKGSVKMAVDNVRLAVSEDAY